MQSVSSKIWTRVAVFISYDDNNYTTGTSSVMVIDVGNEHLDSGLNSGQNFFHITWRK